MRNAAKAVLCILFPAFAATVVLAAPPATQFYKAADSNDWVNKNFQIQERHRRAILVGEPQDYPKTVLVRDLDLNSLEPGKMGKTKEYPIDLIFKTLQEAADAAKGGDIIVVLPGTYAGFEIGDKPEATDGRYIRFVAFGEPGKVTIDRPAPGKDRNWMINLKTAHHVIIQGFNLAGATGPGLEAKGPRTGIMIDGDFGNSGLLAHHIVVIDVFSHNHATWGLTATDSNTVLIQDSCFGLSCNEHSAYISDGSDNYCIRNNVFFGSSASGLQCNLDPEASLAELARHPLLKDYPKDDSTREWAQGILKLATEKFGENNFPDGRGLGFLIENNVVFGNGKKGGGSFNFAGLQDSIIQNNLIYNNLTTGIAEWDNGNPYDSKLADPGPASPAGVTGPDSLPFWGCQRNIVRNNTVIMENASRVAMLLNNGSWGNKLRNNVFINDLSDSLEVSNTSAWQLDSGYNVLNTVSIAPAFMTIATHLDVNLHSALNVKSAKIADEFVNCTNDPWVIVGADWWKLNPDRPDFHPRKNSKLLAGRGDPSEKPEWDLNKEHRAGTDIGAFRAAKE